MANGNGVNAKPTMAELRRIFVEGVPQTLISGLEVKMRPARIDSLLASGKIPDILTPLMMKGLYENINDDVDAFTLSQQEEKEATIEWLNGINAVCEAVLLEPDIVPFLSLADRLWIFKLAFMPAEVLSRFRFEPSGDVQAEADQQGDGDATERPHEPVGQPDSLPV